MPSEDLFPPPRTMLIWAALFEGGLGVLAMTLGWFFQSPPERLIRWTLAGAGWGLAASLPPLVLVLWCLRFPMRPFVELARIVDEFLAPLFRGCQAWELGLISVLAGFGEELLFRGLIQRAIADSYGPWIGLAGASVLFGLFHPITFTYAVLAGMIGFYLGWLWMASDNLLVPILTHTAYDFLMLVYLVHIRLPRLRPPETPG